MEKSEQMPWVKNGNKLWSQICNAIMLHNNLKLKIFNIRPRKYWDFINIAALGGRAGASPNEARSYFWALRRSEPNVFAHAK